MEEEEGGVGPYSFPHSLDKRQELSIAQCWDSSERAESSRTTMMVMSVCVARHSGHPHMWLWSRNPDFKFHLVFIKLH